MKTRKAEKCGCEISLKGIRDCEHSKPSHTPTPWRVIPPSGNFTKSTLVATESGSPFHHGDEIADVMDEANAAFIVKCVNTHELLIEGLKTAIKRLEEVGSPSLAEHLRIDVLAPAEGKGE